MTSLSVQTVSSLTTHILEQAALAEPVKCPVKFIAIPFIASPGPTQKTQSFLCKKRLKVLQSGAVLGRLSNRHADVFDT